ncbi:hypothetical protein SGPA1_50770 [Streptomyces misionensis JCM 4497]
MGHGDDDAAPLRPRHRPAHPAAAVHRLVRAGRGGRAAGTAHDVAGHGGRGGAAGRTDRDAARRRPGRLVLRHARHQPQGPGAGGTPLRRPGLLLARAGPPGAGARTGGARAVRGEPGGSARPVDGRAGGGADRAAERGTGLGGRTARRLGRRVDQGPRAPVGARPHLDPLPSAPGHRRVLPGRRRPRAHPPGVPQHGVRLEQGAAVAVGERRREGP